MLKQILIRYKTSLDQFETITMNKIKYFEEKLKEADMYIRMQNDRVNAISNISITPEGRELFKILKR